jgi:hypothetical protein
MKLKQAKLQKGSKVKLMKLKPILVHRGFFFRILNDFCWESNSAALA